MTRSAFVTGATGFLGMHLIEELREQGWQVTALHRPTSDVTRLKALDVTLVEGDVTDPESVRRAMPEGLDAVFHLAGDLTVASGRNEAQERVNVLGTRAVVDAAVATGARRLVHTSSISAYGPHQGRIDESTPQLGRTSLVSYQRTKWQSEQEVRGGIERGLEAVIMNPATVLGRYARTGWALLIPLMAHGGLRFLPPGAMSFSHGRAVARAHVAAVDKGGLGENYLLGGADHTLAEFLRLCGRIIGCAVPGRVVPPPLLLGRAYAERARARLTKKPPLVTVDSARMMSRRIFCDSSKAVRELGYEPATLETIARDTCEWMIESGMVPAHA